MAVDGAQHLKCYAWTEIRGDDVWVGQKPSLLEHDPDYADMVGIIR